MLTTQLVFEREKQAAPTPLGMAVPSRAATPRTTTVTDPARIGIPSHARIAKASIAARTSHGDSAMHFIAFRLKRAHHASLRLAREITNRCGLTPARFDLLYTVWETYNRKLPQKEIRRALGVARSTVSRMLKSLEQLGIVRREPYPDTRTRLVGFTALGQKLFRELLYMVEGWDEMQLAYEVAFGIRCGVDTFAPMDLFHSRTRTIAHELGDQATLYYPTGHPDD